MPKNRWINLVHSHNQLSSPACAMLLFLFVKVDSNNLVHKTDFFSSIPWIKDRRTANKYWIELIRHGLITKVKAKVWMLSPRESYAEGESHGMLLQKWNEAVNAN